MVGRFVLVFLMLASSAHSTFRNHDRARMFRIFGYLQATTLDSRIASASIHNDIQFHCKAANDNDDGTIFTILPKDIEGFRRLMVGRRLGFFVHGWEIRSRNNIWMLDILKTWVRHENINVCVVDWSRLSQSHYISAALNIYDVGFTMAAVIESLEKTGLFHRSDITLAGYSLGAHAAGFTGQRLGGEVDHIIGLDPAAPMFTVPTDVGAKYRLDPSDGKFVQVIHTTGGILGVSAKSGHADFYPNGGVSPQTNCVPPFRESTSSRIVCSHVMATKYFTYSMERQYPYVGYDCSSFGMFIFGMCRSSEQGRFGIHTNRVAGSFYLITTSTAPYVRRQAVIPYGNLLI